MARFNSTEICVFEKGRYMQHSIITIALRYQYGFLP